MRIKKAPGILGRGGKIELTSYFLLYGRVLLGGTATTLCGVAVEGMIIAPQGEYPEGVSPSGRFFGDFLIGEKVTRVQGGAPALEGSRNCPSAKNPFFWPCLFFLVKTFLCNKERVG